MNNPDTWPAKGITETADEQAKTTSEPTLASSLTVEEMLAKSDAAISSELGEDEDGEVQSKPRQSATPQTAGVGDYEPSIDELLQQVQEAEIHEVFVPELGASGTMFKVRPLSVKEISDIGFKALETRNGKIKRNPKRESELETLFKLEAAVVYPALDMGKASKLLNSPKLGASMLRVLAKINEISSPDENNAGALNYLMGNQVFTLVLLVLHKEGKLLDFLGGDDRAYEVVCERLPLLMGLYEVEKLVNDEGIDLAMKNSGKKPQA